MRERRVFVHSSVKWAATVPFTNLSYRKKRDWYLRIEGAPCLQASELQQLAASLVSEASVASAKAYTEGNRPYELIVKPARGGYSKRHWKDFCRLVVQIVAKECSPAQIIDETEA